MDLADLSLLRELQPRIRLRGCIPESDEGASDIQTSSNLHASYERNAECRLVCLGGVVFLVAERQQR